jgi:phage-related protein
MGSELLIVQEGGVPSDWKPMVSIGWEVKEIRAHSEDGQYRVIYIAKFAEAVYVLHAFQKKTQKTSKHDLEVATRRFKELEQRRRELGL